jgi:outer membrane immunogenic protein
MGVVFGVFAGHNWQLSQNFVVGLEADLTYSTANGTAVVLPTWAWIHGHANFAGSLRARAGYAIDRALFYVTGGLAFGNPSQIRTDLLNNPNIGARYDGFRIGYALGAGVEYMASRAWTVRLEALYYGFSSARPTDLLNNGYVYIARSSQLQARVGAAYRF